MNPHFAQDIALIKGAQQLVNKLVRDMDHLHYDGDDDDDDNDLHHDVVVCHRNANAPLHYDYTQKH